MAKVAVQSGQNQRNRQKVAGYPVVRLAAPMCRSPHVRTRPASALCQAPLTETDQVLDGRYDKVDLPVVRPIVTRVER